jgi:hypothetical protein
MHIRSSPPCNSLAYDRHYPCIECSLSHCFLANLNLNMESTWSVSSYKPSIFLDYIQDGFQEYVNAIPEYQDPSSAVSML